ncbi:MAG: hypothetical protein K5872_06585 [Rhizobiaceae bacterium]|nr:hypothetical protein [Rhizobiaceae bacterium]MCV0405879.1 hypothetical protein [Rhizobiaceae bacterium]
MRDFVPQRTVDDCVIAAFATATERSYEDVATVMGFPCNSETGKPSPLRIVGVNLWLLPVFLLSLGIRATMVPARKAADTKGRLPSSNELKELLHGRSAVLFTPESKYPNTRALHALAWKDDEVIDCREPEGRGKELSELTLLGAMLLIEEKQVLTRNNGKNTGTEDA